MMAENPAGTPIEVPDESLSPAWRKTELARHPKRPYPMDFIQALFTDFSDIRSLAANYKESALLNFVQSPNVEYIRLADAGFQLASYPLEQWFEPLEVLTDRAIRNLLSRALLCTRADMTQLRDVR